jgi:hypothetical protein
MKCRCSGRLCGDEPYDLQSPNIRVTKARKTTYAGHAARMGVKRNTYRVLMRKLDRKEPLGRHRIRWEKNIKMCPPAQRDPSQ